jgi:hypothetical protein
MRGVDYLIENELDYAKEKHAQSDEKQPSNASDAFESIGDDDIPW